MKAWINRRQPHVLSLSPAQEFFGTPCDLPDELVKECQAFEARYAEYVDWLRGMQAALHTRQAEEPDLLKEIPEWLDAASGGGKHKLPGTDQLSNKTSLGERKRMELKSRTSQKKAE